MLEVRTRPGATTFDALLQVRPHHLRSVQIQRDFADPRATLHYVVTPFIRSTFERLTGGFQPQSTRRAWRLTGDYGSGKSGFALALARLGQGDAALLPAALQEFASPVRLEPVLVVGEREQLGESVLRALRATAARCYARLPKPLAAALAAPAEPRNVVAALEKLRTALIADRRAGGGNAGGDGGGVFGAGGRGAFRDAGSVSGGDGAAGESRGCSMNPSPESPQFMEALPTDPAAAVVSIVLAACGGSNAESTSDPSRRFQDMWEIDQIEKDFHHAQTKKNIDLMMSLYAPNATMTRPLTERLAIGR